MWTRRELKECAKQLLKINYWKAVLAGVISVSYTHLDVYKRQPEWFLHF